MERASKSRKRADLEGVLAKVIFGEHAVFIDQQNLCSVAVVDSQQTGIARLESVACIVRQQDCGRQLRPIVVSRQFEARVGSRCVPVEHVRDVGPALREFVSTPG